MDVDGGIVLMKNLACVWWYASLGFFVKPVRQLLRLHNPGVSAVPTSVRFSFMHCTISGRGKSRKYPGLQRFALAQLDGHSKSHFERLITPDAGRLYGH